MKHARFLFAMRLTIVMVSFLLFVATAPFITQAKSISPTQSAQNAWKNAQASGAYHFSTGIEQITFPAPTLANVGRSSRTDQLFIQGETDLPHHKLSLTLWNSGGSALNPQDGIEIRIDGENAQGRQVGGAWQKIDNFSDSFAPDGDLTAYLAGAKHIKRVSDEHSNPQSFSHYTFVLDGPDFAAHLRDQLEAELIKKGELARRGKS